MAATVSRPVDERAELERLMIEAGLGWPGLHNEVQRLPQGAVDTALAHYRPKTAKAKSAGGTAPGFIW
jgi:hypothetical protein